MLTGFELYPRWVPLKGLRLSKLNSADHYKIQKIAHKGLFCLPQSNQAAAIVYGKRVDGFEVTADSCRSLLQSE